MLVHTELHKDVGDVKHDIYILVQRAVRLLNKDLTKLDQERLDPGTLAAYTLIAYAIYLQDELKDKGLLEENADLSNADVHNQLINSLTPHSYQQKKSEHQDAINDIKQFIAEHQEINFHLITEEELQDAERKIRGSSKNITERTQTLAKYYHLKKIEGGFHARSKNINPNREMEKEISLEAQLFNKIQNNRKALINRIGENDIMNNRDLEQLFQINPAAELDSGDPEEGLGSRKEANTTYTRNAQSMSRPKILTKNNMGADFKKVKLQMKREYQLNFLEDNFALKSHMSTKSNYHRILFFDVENLDNEVQRVYKEMAILKEQGSLPKVQLNRWLEIKRTYNENFNANQHVKYNHENRIKVLKHSINDNIKPSFFNFANNELLKAKNEDLKDADLNKTIKIIDDIIENYTHKNPLRRLAHNLMRFLNKDFVAPDTKTQEKLKAIKEQFGIPAPAA